MQGEATKPVEQQLTYQTAVIYVQPLGAGDERAKVTGATVLRGGQEEVDMQTSQRGRGQAAALCGTEKPLLPCRIDLVVPDVRRVADEQRSSINLLKL